MSEYSAMIGGLGYVVYRRDKCWIKKDKIPGNILPLLKVGGPPISDDNLKIESPLHPCVFCKAFTKTSRFINLQTIYICEEHYYSKTTGQIIQQVREQDDEISDKEPQAGQGETFKSKFEE